MQGGCQGASLELAIVLEEEERPLAPPSRRSTKLDQTIMSPLCEVGVRDSSIHNIKHNPQKYSPKMFWNFFQYIL